MIVAWLYAGFLAILPLLFSRRLIHSLPPARQLLPYAVSEANVGWTRAILMGSVAWYIGAVSTGFSFAESGEWFRAILYPLVIAGVIVVFGASLVWQQEGINRFAAYAAGRLARRRGVVLMLLLYVAYLPAALLMGSLYGGAVLWLNAVLVVALGVLLTYLIRRLN